MRWFLDIEGKLMKYHESMLVKRQKVCFIIPLPSPDSSSQQVMRMSTNSTYTSLYDKVVHIGHCF